MPYSEDDLRLAHRHHRYRAEIEASDICGCFYCCKTFPPSEIRQWVRSGKDALTSKRDGSMPLCPRCDIDAVLGSASNLPVADEAFLRAMHERWFGRLPRSAPARRPYAHKTIESVPAFGIMIWRSEDDETFVAEVPELAGCLADGATYEEALANARRMIAEWVETARDIGHEIPSPGGRMGVLARRSRS